MDDYCCTVDGHPKANHRLDGAKTRRFLNGNFPLPFPQLVKPRQSSGCHQQYGCGKISNYTSTDPK